MSTDPSIRQTASELASAVPPEARLEASRLAMRVAMTPEPPKPKSADGSMLDKLLHAPKVQTLLSNSVVSTLTDTVKQWWLAHPWRPLLTAGAEAASQMMVPVAQRHPVRVLAVAMLGGAVLSRWRPWKWLLATAGPALLASMLPSLISRVATRVPLKTLLRLVGVASSRPRETRTLASAGAAGRVEVAAKQ